MPFHLALLLVLCACAPPAERTPFAAVAAPLGLARAHRGGNADKAYIAEAKGGGAAWLDYDGDGDLDLYWVNGASLADMEGGEGHALYRNEGGRGFSEVTDAARARGRGWGMGAVAADYDGDNDDDVLITALRTDQLLRNDGGRFSEAAEAAGLADTLWSTGAAFADYDRDGDLDLYVARYARFDPGKIAPLGTQWKGVDVFVGPLGLVPEHDALYRNEGDGTFREQTRQAGLSRPDPGYGFGVLFVDVDDDGDPDLYVANDSSPNFLYRNEGDGRFADISLRASAAYGEAGNAQAGMGVAWGDFDADGRPDLFVTHFEDDYNTLYRNLGEGRFADISFAAGLGRPSLPFVGFGALFLDHDLDGDLDLFVANGHVYPQIEGAGSGATYAQPDHLYDNQGDGTFALLSPHADPPRVGRGAALADYDDDGDPDILVSNLDAAPSLLRNDAAAGHWLGIELRGRGKNTRAVGARVRLKAGGRWQVRDALCGDSFLCRSDPRLHFGLGPHARVDSLVVRWPDGQVQHLSHLPADRYLRLEQGAPEPRSP